MTELLQMDLELNLLKMVGEKMEAILKEVVNLAAVEQVVGDLLPILLVEMVEVAK